VKIAIGITYRGTEFEGWQSQPTRNAVQDHLERALAAIACERIALTGAGRTDAGVHAAGQVAHFETRAERPLTAWVRGANSLLPSAIAIEWATPVQDAFHARYSAISRTYRYVLYNHPVRPALLTGLVGWFHQPLRVDAVRLASGFLLGEHDFSAFRSSECQARTPVRRMERAEVAAHGPYLLFDFTANAFLHHMVRNIVGSLVYVGKGEHPPEWVESLLRGRDRRFAALTFSGAGLYLTQVRYDSAWGLPNFPPAMPFHAEALECAHA
jgi:tRNA pseudouridine38-40 synthase